MSACNCSPLRFNDKACSAVADADNRQQLDGHGSNLQAASRQTHQESAVVGLNILPGILQVVLSYLSENLACRGAFVGTQHAERGTLHYSCSVQFCNCRCMAAGADAISQPGQGCCKAIGKVLPAPQPQMWFHHQMGKQGFASMSPNVCAKSHAAERSCFKLRPHRLRQPNGRSTALNPYLAHAR